MTDLEHNRLKAVVAKQGLWFLKFWQWPSLVRACKEQADQLFMDLEGVRESLKVQEQQAFQMKTLAQRAVEGEHRALDGIAAERRLSTELTDELGNAKIQVQKLSETVGGLENRISRGELETERIKAELSKTQAELARSQFEEKREKQDHKLTFRKLTLLREYVHVRDSVDIPARRGIRAAILNGKRYAIGFLLFLPLMLSAQFPPPLWRNPWSTNQTPRAVEGVNNLSVTNLGSGTNWQFFNVGPKTVARLSDVTNIASSFSSGGFTTNDNQFLGTPLSIKSGAFLTNMNYWGEGTNHDNLWLDGNLSPLSDDARSIGDIGSAWFGAVVKSGGVIFNETGGGAQSATIKAASAMAGNYVMTLPDAQGADGTVITNNGSGTLGWWNATAVIAQKQFGSANLTNWSNIPTGAMANVVSTTFLTNWANAISNLTQTKQQGSAILTNLSGTGAQTNGMNVSQFLTNSPVISMRAGALLTNTVHWQSNALLPALIATNQPGGTIDLVTMLTTNAAGLMVTSNGAVVVRGVIGSTTNSFEVRASNNVNVPLAVTHSNTVRITGPVQSSFGASVTIGSASGSSQNNIELYAGDTFSGRWRSDSSGNQVVSAGGSGALFFNTDSGNGQVHFQASGAGSLWSLIPSSDVAALHGGTLRRGQITNVWDIWGRTNLWLTRTGLLDGIVVTNDIRFLGHNSATGAVWTCTNTTTGEGTWLGNINLFQPANAVLTNLVSTVANNVTNVVSLSTTNATSKPLTNSYTTGVVTLFGLEAGGNVTLTPNGSNIVIASTAGSGPVTNGNQFGAQVTLTIKDGAFLTNAIAFPTGAGTAPALTVTNVPGIGTNTWQVLNTNGQPVIFAMTNNGVTLVSSNQLVLGPQTNAASENITGGVTNWAGTEAKGTLFASSNMLVRAGQSVSNAWVGGNIVWDLNNYTNLNGNVATFSNLAACTIPAHTLTNNGDMIRAYWGGVGATAMQNTQNFLIVFGSTTLLDTGLQIGSNYLYRAKIEITRTGNNSQHVDAQLEWLPNLLGTTGLPYTSTNVMRETAVETNGINTTLALRASARRVGALTNTQFRVYYDPAIR